MPASSVARPVRDVRTRVSTGALIAAVVAAIAQAPGAASASAPVPASAGAPATSPAGKPPAAPAPVSKVRLRNGDRVVLVGGATVERDILTGRLETLLTAAHPGIDVTFRNLGWAGDTVWGHARAGFGGPADGFRQLDRQLALVKPTVLVLHYGTSESWDGAAKVDAFLKQTEALLALPFVRSIPPEYVIFVSPILQGRPDARLPDPTAHNRDVHAYADKIRDFARARGSVFADVRDLLGSPGDMKAQARLTHNGVHLTDAGHAELAARLAPAFGIEDVDWRLVVDVAAGTAKPAVAGAFEASPPVRSAEGVTVKLREPRIAAAWPNLAPVAEVRGLPDGVHELLIDGAVAARADAAAWAKGVSVGGPAFAAPAEALRAEINIKSELFFHRWRPQNETYLFGFRKHEQGRNGAEIPQFDPLVESREARIKELRQPKERTLVLRPAK